MISLSLPTHILHWSLLSFSFLPPEPKLYLPHHLTAIDSILPASSSVCTPPFSLPFASPPAINIFISIHGFRWLLEDVFGFFFLNHHFHYCFIAEKPSMILSLSQLGFQSSLRCVYYLPNFIFHHYNTNTPHSQVPNISALSPMFGATISPTPCHAVIFSFSPIKNLSHSGHVILQHHDKCTAILDVLDNHP